MAVCCTRHQAAHEASSDLDGSSEKKVMGEVELTSGTVSAARGVDQHQFHVSVQSRTHLQLT